MLHYRTGVHCENWHKCGSVVYVDKEITNNILMFLMLFKGFCNAFDIPM
jgi:hypothetical protein